MTLVELVIGPILVLHLIIYGILHFHYVNQLTEQAFLELSENLFVLWCELSILNYGHSDELNSLVLAVLLEPLLGLRQHF